MIFDAVELAHLVVVTLALGFIFMSYLPRAQPRSPYGQSYGGFDRESFKLAIMVTAPAVILHELGHKFAALFLGLTATFKAWWFGLFLGVVLKLFNSPLIILAPGYVEIGGNVTPFASFITAFSGPFINLLLWFVAWLVLERKTHMTQRSAIVWHLTKQVNMFLFIFNMIPIPPLDGSKVFAALWTMLF